MPPRKAPAASMRKSARAPAKKAPPKEPMPPRKLRKRKASAPVGTVATPVNDEHGDDGDNEHEVPSTPAPRKRQKPGKKSASTRWQEFETTRKNPHIPLTVEERKNMSTTHGRGLLSWSRPHMNDKLLLCLQYELARHDIDVPWDIIAHRLHPGTSTHAVLQHLIRVRKQLLAKGHLVCPPLPKTNTVQKTNQLLRGYIRANDGGDELVVREVLFTEACDDRRINLPDAGNYLSEKDMEARDVDLRYEADAEYGESRSALTGLHTPTPPKSKGYVRQAIAKTATALLVYSDSDSTSSPSGSPSSKCRMSSRPKRLFNAMGEMDEDFIEQNEEREDENVNRYGLEVENESDYDNHDPNFKQEVSNSDPESDNNEESTRVTAGSVPDVDSGRDNDVEDADDFDDVDDVDDDDDVDDVDDVDEDDDVADADGEDDYAISMPFHSLPGPSGITLPTEDSSVDPMTSLPRASRLLPAPRRSPQPTQTRTPGTYDARHANLTDTHPPPASFARFHGSFNAESNGPLGPAILGTIRMSDMENMNSAALDYAHRGYTATTAPMPPLFSNELLASNNGAVMAMYDGSFSNDTDLLEDAAAQSVRSDSTASTHGQGHVMVHSHLQPLHIDRQNTAVDANRQANYERQPLYPSSNAATCNIYPYPFTENSTQDNTLLNQYAQVQSRMHPQRQQNQTHLQSLMQPLPVHITGQSLTQIQGQVRSLNPSSTQSLTQSSTRALAQALAQTSAQTSTRDSTQPSTQSCTEDKDRAAAAPWQSLTTTPSNQSSSNNTMPPWTK